MSGIRRLGIIVRVATMKGNIFIGGVHPSVERRQLEHIFGRYGTMNRCELKRGYAFVDYEENRSAEEAIYHENDRTLNGIRICVEWAKGTQGFERNQKQRHYSSRDNGRYSDRKRDDYDHNGRKHRRRHSTDSGSDRYRKKRHRRSPSRSHSRNRNISRDRSRSRSPSLRSISERSDRN